MKTGKAMEREIINQTQAIELLRAKEDLSAYTLQFDTTPIESLDAILLGKNGIIIPSDLVFYDDENIDYSDDPGLTDDDLKSGKIKWVVSAELFLDEEVKNWIKTEKIDLDELSSRLVTEFYRHSAGV